MVAINPSSRPSCPEKYQGFDLGIGFSSKLTLSTCHLAVILLGRPNSERHAWEKQGKREENSNTSEQRRVDIANG